MCSDEYVPPTSLQSTKHDITIADFKLFIVIWNQAQYKNHQGASTPDLHFKMAEWLEQKWMRKPDSEQLHLLLMAFRSAGKSTIVGLYAAWLLYKNPDLRIMVLAADSTLAGKMVRNVKRIIERHPLTAHMKPARADQWASDRFTVRRMIELRDPSMVAYGVSSNITGARADVVICDDVEVPNTCDTAEKRENLRDRLLELNYVLVTGGVMLYVGTPHHYYSIYAETPRQDVGEDEPFLDGYDRLVLPILDESGNCVWPERFSDDDILRMKSQTGVNKFTSQMMLKPVNIAEGRLEFQNIRRYDCGIAYVKELKRLEINNIPMVAACGYWDPSFGKAKNDGSVLAIVFIDADNNFYLHDLKYLTVQKHSPDDEATQQCKIIAETAKHYMLPRLVVESNGIGKFLPSILKREIVNAGSLARVQTIHNSRAKDLRILEAFDIALNTRRLHVHERVLKTPLSSEIQDWRPNKAGARDDGLDAVAGAISHLHETLDAYHLPACHTWMRRGKAVQAKTEFKV